MLNDFFQPGLILIVFGVLILVVPKALQKFAVLAGPILTVFAVLIWDKDKICLLYTSY